MERNVIVKIGRPSPSDRLEFERAMGTERFETEKAHGLKQTGTLFQGEITVAIVGTDYGLELICRILTAACVPYSLEQGRPCRRRKKPCGQSTAYRLKVVASTLELQLTDTNDCTLTTAESAPPPEETNGDTTTG